MKFHEVVAGTSLYMRYVINTFPKAYHTGVSRCIEHMRSIFKKYGRRLYGGFEHNRKFRDFSQLVRGAMNFLRRKCIPSLKFVKNRRTITSDVPS